MTKVDVIILVFVFLALGIVLGLEIYSNIERKKIDKYLKDRKVKK